MPQNEAQLIQNQTAETLLAEAKAAAGRMMIVPAIHKYAEAVAAAPGNASYKNEFVQFIQGFRLRIISQTLKSLLIACLLDQNAAVEPMATAWASLLSEDPEFVGIARLIKQKKYPAFVRILQTQPGLQVFMQPYFLAGLVRLTVPDLAFERCLTFLRRFLLEHPETVPPQLVLALACYCRQTGYIFYKDPAEMKLCADLASRLAEQTVKEASFVSLLCCYRRPEEVLAILKIAPHAVSGETGQWLHSVIAQTLRLNEERAKVQSLTPVEDSVSEKVSAQYERYPYPCWSGYLADIKGQTEQVLIGQKARILIAGCGTGMEAIELAAAFPESSILAVDLSFSSLAYAQMKAAAFHIRNITFRRADILQLGQIEEKFDFIACSGVLHHMRDPEAGWRVLNELLAPNGLMRIALYSTRARRYIAKAREAIVRSGRCPANDEGMRAFRHDGRKLLGRAAWKNITALYDFYLMPECCDLLFHVQEHTFTPRQIAGLLDKLGLRAVELHLPAKDHARFNRHYPEPGQQTDLLLWDSFEQKHSDIFRQMIRFWCVQKSLNNEYKA